MFNIFKKIFKSKDDFINLKLDDRIRIADKLVDSGQFENTHLHDLEEMLKIKTVDNDVPVHLGISLSPYYENEPIVEYRKKREKTDEKIKKDLYR